MDDVTQRSTLEHHWGDSLLAGCNAPYLEELYERYLLDPSSVPADWQDYFDALQPSGTPVGEPVHTQVISSFRAQALNKIPATIIADQGAAQQGQQVKVLQVINAYRFSGHLRAACNPLNIKTLPEAPELTLAHHGLQNTQLNTVFDTGSLVGPDRASLGEILKILQQTYLGSIGAEYMHIVNTEEKRWIQNHLEGVRGKPPLTPDMQRRLLDRLTAAEGLEQYLDKKYVGQKRFSLEGADSLIPLLDTLIHAAGSQGTKEVVIGMAHRGRLNVLINLLGKTPAELYLEFEGKAKPVRQGTGDVKYHQGFSSNITTPGGAVHAVVAFNPSHLEIVGPVVEGSVRARQDQCGDSKGDLVLPVVIHGDAAFAGQGVVMETFNMSQTRGYSTKGTLHIIINNQIGFTTSRHADARSTLYSSDVAKMVNAPIFHVNGDDPEAVSFITRLALDYRMTFHKDVVIDLVCYRRHGHNEADEPLATQPMMYKAINTKPTTRTLYAQKLIAAGIISADEERHYTAEYLKALASGASVAPDLSPNDDMVAHQEINWQPYLEQACSVDVDTAVDVETLRKLNEQLNHLPDEVEPHRTVAKVLQNRNDMAAGKIAIDWGFAETMAYATLLKDGYNVRLSGQDSGRGTFFHRHAVIHNQKDGSVYVPLRHLGTTKSNFLVIDSLLSEAAVLAFEYGYATAAPETLTLWEAQFGDFANNAQVVIDQFISAGEQKWGRLSGLVLLLPHGYEGQGPEHSSARLERFMQLCAEHNMQVCVPTTAAQIFHLLRKQMLMKCRKPLIVFTPKSLLRHKLAASPLHALSEGHFLPVIPEIDPLDDDKVRRVILCSGKVYYDLLNRRREEHRNDVAIIRMEQLYPFPSALMKTELDRYTKAKHFIWCQEEPRNQGAWFTSQHNVRTLIKTRAYLEYAGRPPMAAPAVGYPPLHAEQLQNLLDEAFGTKTNPNNTKGEI